MASVGTRDWPTTRAPAPSRPAVTTMQIMLTERHRFMGLNLAAVRLEAGQIISLS